MLSHKKIRGTPKNWPNSSPEEIANLPYRKVSIGTEQQYRFCNNFVKTSKYEWYNFLPKFLFEEFNPTVKSANVYFLIIACLQLVPAITNTNGIPTTLIPLLFVVMGDCVIMLREDVRRHAADKEANSSMTLRLNSSSGQYESTIWSSIQVGDIVKVESRTNVPADIVVLSVSEKYDPPQGICYVDTKSLDGETNLKMRHAHQLAYHKVINE
jgi:magnesium-transporting ATPase (P-type)